MVEHNVVVMAAVSDQDDPRLNLIPILWNLCSEPVGGIKFWDPVEGSDTGDPSWVIVMIEYLFAFQFWCCKLCVENRWGGGRKHWFVN